MRPGHVHSSLLAVNQSVSPTESKSTSPLSQHRSFLVRLMITAIDIESKTFLHRSTNLFLAHRAARTIFNSSFNIFFLLFFSTRERISHGAHMCASSRIAIGRAHRAAFERTRIDPVLDLDVGRTRIAKILDP